MNEGVSDEEAKEYLSAMALLFPDVDVMGEYLENGAERQSLYPTEEERSRRIFEHGSEGETRMERIALSLDNPNLGPFNIDVNTAYKPKSRKVRPVDLTDGTGEAPGGRKDWFERSKARETPQEHTGKYARYLLPRIASIPKGSRLTPERLTSLLVGDWLWESEREMFDEMMLNREGAIAFDWKEVSKIHEDVSPPVRIKTIQHTAWQEKSFHCPKALFPVVAKMLQERLDRGVLEKSDGPYRNPWFLVAKKAAGTYRLINAAMKMNSVTLRDANIPPSVDEFSEEFAGCFCASLIDFFSGYDQLTLDVRSRDMTAFMTPLGLLRMTTPPQGATNSVAQFVRVIMTILEDVFPRVAMPFLDDVGVKGPYTDYDNELALPGIRRFVFEHIQNLDRTLDRIERAQACIGPKSQFCQNGMVIVGFVCSSGGRSPESAKVIKILGWTRCDNVSEVKAFIGICVYYRIWIQHFGIITEPLYRLTRKDEPFEWGKEQKAAMVLLQDKLTTAPVLCKIHYDPADGWGMIILGVDASQQGYGGTLGQYDDKGRKRVARYESGLWNAAERNYDATKRECRGVLKCLRKLRSWLYGVHFILETDANTLVAQLNRAATDLPGALVTRWLAWIRLFDFEVKHVRGSTHTAADGLSRRPRMEDDNSEEGTDIDEFIAIELDCVGIAPISTRERKTSRKVEGRPFVIEGGHVKRGFLPELLGQVWGNSPKPGVFGFQPPTSAAFSACAASTAPPEINEPLDNDNDNNAIFPLDDSYSDHSQDIAWYLTTLKRPEWLSRVEFRKLIRESVDYSVRDKMLWRNATKSYPPRLVLDDLGQRMTVMTELHDKSGHAGRESTYHRVASRYYWEGCYEDVRDFVASCSDCQHKSKKRHEEALYPQRVVPLFHCIGIDVVKLPQCGMFDSLVVARDDFSGWVEAKPMKNPTSKKIAKFIYNDIICRHGVFGHIRLDGGPEFKGAVIKELNRLGIRRTTISAYNSKANGMIERGHQPIIVALIALTKRGKKSWLEHLPTVLFADRTTIHRPTGCTPFYMVYGREAVLPVETRFPTWRTLGWDEVHDRAELLELRTRQIEMRDEDMEESRLKKERSRKQGQAYFDAHH